MVREACRLAQLLDRRPKRAVAVIGRALIADEGVRLPADYLPQRLDDARLADASIADQQHALAFI